VAYHLIHLDYVEDSTSVHNMTYVNYCRAFGFGGVFAAVAVLPWIVWRRFQTMICVVILGGLLATTFAERYFAITATPAPVIDVYNLLRDDADCIIAGNNPYTHDIVSPYGTARAFDYGLVEPADPRPAGYPPLPYLLSVPPRLFSADVRW